ncbi:hypothetical protein QQG74_09660 [Micromonospora sp. FIMYZ51]|uniref:hypothetical protein n=1 Tax=Micromonospora sp. FIMYZ51 TaxID=3051832 RepID=UPI00311E7A5F
MSHRPVRVQLDTSIAPYSKNAFAVALRESATAPTAERIQLGEAVTAAITEAPALTGGVVDILLIEAGWNLSGSRYYPAETLARDLPQVMPAGTHMHWDHQTPTEEAERPARSLSTLAAVLVEDPYPVDGGRQMRAKARVFAAYRESVREMWRDIGVSINADGVGNYGERDGRKGLIVEAITHGKSVDFVTKAGAGGRILSLLESDHVSLREARTFGGWLESRLHLALTQYADEAYGDGRLTREERITLSAAIGDGLKAWTARVDAEAPQLFARDLYDEPSKPVAVTESEQPAGPAATPAEPVAPDPVEPEADAPSAPAETTPEDPPAGDGGDSTTEDAPGTTPAEQKEGVMPEEKTEEVKAREAAEQARAEAETKLTEALREAEESRKQAADTALRLARFEATEKARPLAETKLTESDLPAAARTRVLTAVTRDVPLTEANILDEAAFTALVESAITDEATYLASLNEANDAGKVTGMGGTTQIRESTAGQTVDREAVRARLVESYKQSGLSDTAAQIAATGRTF